MLDDIQVLWVCYSAIWIVLFTFIFFMGKKQDKIIKEIADLKELYK